MKEPCLASRPAPAMHRLAALRLKATTKISGPERQPHRSKAEVANRHISQLDGRAGLYILRAHIHLPHDGKSRRYREKQLLERSAPSLDGRSTDGLTHARKARTAELLTKVEYQPVHCVACSIGPSAVAAVSVCIFGGWGFSREKSGT